MASIRATNHARKREGHPSVTAAATHATTAIEGPATISTRRPTSLMAAIPPWLAAQSAALLTHGCTEGTKPECVKWGSRTQHRCVNLSETKPPNASPKVRQNIWIKCSITPWEGKPDQFKEPLREPSIDRTPPCQVGAVNFICRIRSYVSLIRVWCHQRVTSPDFMSPVAYWWHGRNPGSRRFFTLPLYQQG